MNKLIVFNTEKEKQFVDARQLHASLEVGRDFSNWIKERIEKYGFMEGEDFTPILAKSTGGRPLVNYSLSIEMAKELAIVENNEKGQRIRKYLIKVESDWNTPEMAIARGIKAAESLIKKQMEKIAELQPKAIIYDKIANSVGLKQVGAVAKELGKEPNKFFKELRKEGVLHYKRRDNVPNQKYINSGLFEVKATLVTHGDKNYSHSTTYVTPRGELWLAQRFRQTTKKLQDSNLDGYNPEATKNTPQEEALL